MEHPFGHVQLPIRQECELLHLELTNGAAPARNGNVQPASGSTPRRACSRGRGALAACGTLHLRVLNTQAPCGARVSFFLFVGRGSCTVDPPKNGCPFSFPWPPGSCCATSSREIVPCLRETGTPSFSCSLAACSHHSRWRRKDAGMLRVASRLFPSARGFTKLPCRLEAACVEVLQP